MARSKLNEAERAELNSLKEHKRIHQYVGFNVIRHWFSEKTDADRFLQLIIKDGADKPVWYGCECEFGVTKSLYGGKTAWEVAEG